MSTHNTFKGPLFISGMPRSGTKLLRDLMNNHSNISIPEHESHFIPMMIRTYGLDIDLNNDNNLTEVLKTFRGTKFYGNYPQHAAAISLNAIKEALPDRNWATVLEYIFRTFAPDQGYESFIWGDKTPGYILHYDLLKKIFPHARFVHIIRDPRDYALSVNNAWGRSMFRAAQRWHETMQKIRSKPKGDHEYLEVFYEGLLDDPAKVLAQICEFAGETYEEDMPTLRKPTENLGDAKGKSAIMKGNKNKFLERIPTEKLKRIEELVCAEAEKMRYTMVNNPVDYKPLGKNEILWLKVHDGFRSAWFHMQEKGAFKGFQYFMKLHKQGSWRGVSS